MSDAAIDMDELKEIMDDDMNLIQDCFADYIQDWTQIYEEIEKAGLEKNSENLNKSAHKLKGIFKYLAAPAAANIANSLESAGRENKMEDTQEKIENLKLECQKVADYIKNFEI